MGDAPKVCSMPQFEGRPVVTKEYVEEMKSADLNFDGVADEYFMVSKKVIKICGKLPGKSAVNLITNNYGKFDKMTEKENGATLYGRDWRASYKYEDGMTTIVAKSAVPAFAEGMATSFKVTHLGKSVRLGDPITLKDGKDYFISGIDLSQAVRWNGKKMTVDYKKVQVAVMPKSAVMDIQNKKPIDKNQVKGIRLSDIKSIKSRSEFPEIYAQK